MGNVIFSMFSRSEKSTHLLSALRDPRPQTSEQLGSHNIRPNIATHRIIFSSKMVMKFVLVYRTDTNYKLFPGISDWGTLA